MNLFPRTAALVVIVFAASANNSNAFTISQQSQKTAASRVAFTTASSSKYQIAISLRTRNCSSKSLVRFHASKDKDDEIERLRSMAAKLRAEAANLEAEKSKELANAAEKAFRQFDTNKDGEVSMEELKQGLERILKTELSEKRVKAVMESFDSSGDGALQLDEFVGVDKFRSKLEALARDEKARAAEAQKQAKLEEEAAKFLQARIEILNDKPPTNADKALSLLPYLFPLLDGIPYGRFLLGGENGNSPVAAALAALYTLYRTVPFSGFIAFFALSFLSGNPSLNRLIRFNMQQAIFLDIALFFPGLVTGLTSLLLSALGQEVPAVILELTTNGIFVALVISLAYCTVSSILGTVPDKIPLISQAVSDRMPTIDMFDDTGRFLPRQTKKKDDKDEKDGDKS